MNSKMQKSYQKRERRRFEIEEELNSKIAPTERDDKGLQKIVTKFSELQPEALP